MAVVVFALRGAEKTASYLQESAALYYWIVAVLSAIRDGLELMVLALMVLPDDSVEGALFLHAQAGQV